MASPTCELCSMCYVGSVPASGTFAPNQTDRGCIKLCAQTGPKGVIMDYHRHMQDKESREAEKKREHNQAIEQSAPTVKTWVSTCNLSQRSR